MAQQNQEFAQAFASLQTNDTCSEAVVTLHDGSRLCFIHTVEKRQALSVWPRGPGNRTSCCRKVAQHDQNVPAQQQAPGDLVPGRKSLGVAT